jgi:hypothetical protein
MRRRMRAWRMLRRGQLRWWLVYGSVRSGTTLMTDLIAPHARYVVSDWGLRHVLGGPLSNPPSRFDPARYQRAFLAEVLAACDRNRNGTIDLVFKQANLRMPEYEVLVAHFGLPERQIFCLRDPGGYMRSATTKFPDYSLEHLREFNYVGTAQEHDRIGGDVFLYHPQVTGDHYAEFIRPLPLSPAQRDSIRYTGSAAEELVNDEMRAEFRRLLPLAVNAPKAASEVLHSRSLTQ